MKNNSLIAKFNATRRAMEQERDKLAAKLAEYDAALASTSTNNGHVRSSALRSPANNKLSLREAITRVTKAGPLTKGQILEAVTKIGYRFATKKPMGSINALLYSESSPFTRKNGKFGI